MQKITKLFFAVFVCSLIILSFSQFPTSSSELMTFEEQALAYINKVLPLDMTQYNVTYCRVGWLPPGYQDTRVWNTTSVYLQAPNSSVSVGFIFVNGIMRQCGICYLSGTPLMEPGYSGTGAVIEILTRHSEMVGMDSQQLINALSNGKSEGVSLKIDERPMYNMEIVDDRLEEKEYLGLTTSYIWTITVDAVGYNRLVMSFKNGYLSNIEDDRPCYPIGGTNIDISKEQAIEIAKEYVSNYTSNFNLTITQHAASIGSFLRNSEKLYPCWMVDLRFNLNVNDVSVYLWADTGEVFWCYQGGSPLNQSELKLLSAPKFSQSFDVPTPAPTQQANAGSSQPQATDKPVEPQTSTPTPDYRTGNEASAQTDTPMQSTDSQSRSILAYSVAVLIGIAVFGSIAVIRRL